MEAINFFKALSDPNRLRILKMLQSKTLCVCELTEALQLAASTVSNHCKILREVGFLVEEKDGKWVNYSINPTPADLRIPAFLSRLDFWLADQNATIRDIKLAQTVNRKIICCR